jgi:hypothetical protein
MIKKNERPVKRLWKSVIFEEKLSDFMSTRLLGIKLLRECVSSALSAGRICLDYKFTHHQCIEFYGGVGYRVVVGTIYVGRRKCLDAKLRRTLRRGYPKNRSDICVSLLSK